MSALANTVRVVTTDGYRDFTNVDIMSINTVLSSSLSGDELAYDELSTQIYSTAYIHVRFIPQNSDGLIDANGNTFCVLPDDTMIDKIPYGSRVYWWNNGNLMGIFYVKSCERQSKTNFMIVATSPVGMLDSITHLGGIYEGTTFGELVQDIVGNRFGTLHYDTGID